jgi:Flp pilus assembly protein TadG
MKTRQPASTAFGTLLTDVTGQAVAEFSLVVFLLVLVLFSIVETGLLLNDRMALMSAAREAARICAVEGGRTQNALTRLNDLLTSAGISPSSVGVSIWPAQAIYGTTIHVELSYQYVAKSPIFRSLAGPAIPISAKVVTRSEFVPR